MASTELLLILLALILVVLASRYVSLARRYRALRSRFDAMVRREAQRLAEAMFREWASQRLEAELRRREQEIRRDAIERSVSVLLGRISEHIAPLVMVTKLGVNPRDLRFLGSPVDYIAFKGLSDGKPEEILFIEVKTSRTPQLTKREQAVKKLVEARRVRWVTLSLYDLVETAKEELKRELEAGAGESDAGRRGGLFGRLVGRGKR